MLFRSELITKNFQLAVWPNWSHWDFLSSTELQTSLTMTATMIPEPAVCCFEELSIAQGSSNSLLVCHLLNFENILTDILFSSHQDQKLTKEEVLDNWNMFVGSQATNYGEDLTRNHDELWCSIPTSVPQTFSPLYWNHRVHPLFLGEMAKNTQLNDLH